MNTDCINNCLEYMSDHLNDHRRTHTLGVRDTAVKLAQIYGADTKKAEIAALFHDIAKPLDQESSDAEVVKYGLRDEFLGNRNLAHGPIAAAWAKDRFGVDDEEILDAIRYHTSSKAGISLLSKIIFVADTVEPGRTYKESTMLREKSYEDLEYVYKYILRWMKQDLERKGVSPGTDTLNAFKEIENG